MNRKEQEMSRMLILSPLDGRVIPLEEVPDEVFAEKLLGDGAAVIPENGNIYSPLDGEIIAIPESLHAYGIRSDAGIEMIVHFGLETVNLKGEGFSPKVKVGDRVKAGQDRRGGGRKPLCKDRRDPPRRRDHDGGDQRGCGSRRGWSSAESGPLGRTAGRQGSCGSTLRQKEVPHRL